MEDFLVEFLGKGFVVMLMISMPCVLVAAGVGLVVGILQAVTQVQEQTIAAAPKICLVFLTIVVLGGYYIKVLTNFIFEGTHLAFEIVPKNEKFVLPSDYYKYTRPFSAEMQDGVRKNSSLNEKLLKHGATGWSQKATKQQINIKSKQQTVVEPNFIEKQKIRENQR